MSLKNLEVSDPRFEKDGLRSVTITSDHLRGRGDITLYVPELARARRSVPLVILLHGVYGSHWGWALRGGAHRTAARMIESGEIPPLVLAMPSDGLWGEGSGYVPQKERNFERWIVDDVPKVVSMVETCVDEASPRFIAGLSMGGFGALRLAACYPDKFRAASGHSSATHLEKLRPYFAENAEQSLVASEEQSLLELMTLRREQLRPFRFDCGTEDFLYADNRELHLGLKAVGVPHEYEEFEGAHSWEYWEKHLAESLLFFARQLPA